jgi:uncharacterized membrane protein
MKTWLIEFEIALKKHFYTDEVKRIVDYYEEMINDRIQAGEDEKEVLAEYNIDSIVKEMTLDVLVKRENNTLGYVTKSLKQLLIILLSTPLLIPIGALFLVILILLFSIAITSFSIVFASLLVFIVFLIDLFSTGLTISETFGLLGISLMAISVIFLCSYWIFSFMYNLLKNMLTKFTKLAYSKGGRHENSN